MNREHIIDLIVEHNMEQKWLQDKLKALNEAQAYDNEIARKMKECVEEWNVGTLHQRRENYRRKLAELRNKEVVE